MGNKNYRGTSDNRSTRASRAPGFDMILMRTLPREPVRPPPTVPIDAPSVTNLLLRLPAFLREAEDELSRHVEYTARDGQFHTFIDELTGAGQRDLLCHGAYALSEAGHLRRILYIGGAAATMVRHRVTDHLAFRGGSLKSSVRSRAAPPSSGRSLPPARCRLITGVRCSTSWRWPAPHSRIFTSSTARRASCST